ncbi:MAG: hypothetical protein ACLR6J_16635 [Parabacteroides merdae]
MFGLPMKVEKRPGREISGKTGKSLSSGTSELAVLSSSRPFARQASAFYNKKNGFAIVGDSFVRRKHRPYRSMGRKPRGTACRYPRQITVVAGRDRGIPGPWPRDTNH